MPPRADSHGDTTLERSAVTEELDEEADSTVIMVKRRLELPSRVQRRLGVVSRVKRWFRWR